MGKNAFLITGPVPDDLFFRREEGCLQAAVIMKNKLIALFLAAVFLCMAALPALAATTLYATVMGGYLRLRISPSYQAQVIRSYRSGTVVTVLGREYGWAQVITPDGRTGYMDERYLSFGTSPEPEPSKRIWTDINRNYWVTSQNGLGVRMRSTPSVNSHNILGLYPVGRTAYVIKQSNDGWSYISIDGKYGYMMTLYLAPAQVTPVYPTPVPVRPTQAPSVTVAPIPGVLSSVSLSSASPRVGDTLYIAVLPATATYMVIWYRDDNQLLSTDNQYTVSPADLGHIIHIHVSGTGSSSGVVIDKSTRAVAAASASGETQVDFSALLSVYP